MTHEFPLISQDHLDQLLKEHYGLRGQLQLIAGEFDLNYLLTTHDHQRYLLKISREGETAEYIDFQAAVMEHLSSFDFPFALPEVIKTVNGSIKLTQPTNQGTAVHIRLQSWLPGRVMAGVCPHTPEMLKSLGAACGHLCRALQRFDHPLVHRNLKWNPSATLENRKHRVHIKDAAHLALVDHLWAYFEEHILPKLSKLRKSVIYHDANDYNILVSEDLASPSVCGIIDFGDVLYTQTVNDLAIACAYAMLDKADPLESASHVVSGFHEVFPLEVQEIELLLGLIMARMLTSVAVAAANKVERPDNEYLRISERPAWALLKKLKDISPAFAHFYFRRACGWEPCPDNIIFHQKIKAIDFAPVVDFPHKKITPFDLSVGSLELGNNSRFATISAFEKTINSMYKDADLGVGGYNETRPVYTTDAYQVMGNDGPQWRVVHLGLDIWGKAGTPVFAPLEGCVHSFQNNAFERDYGPTIILEHQLEGLTFYSLYGHLNVDSLDDLYVGKKMAKGEEIARFGPAPENGNWPPHLHFQLMLDLFDKSGDFPGATFPTEADIWLSNCPDPALIIPVDLPLGKKQRWSAEQILEKRKKHLGRSLSISYKKPLHMVRGYGQYLYDATARRYLDTINNVAHVGHEHPKVVEAAQRQMGLLNTNTRYLHEEVVRFAEELASKLPEPLSVVHFVNSGSEANELALRMAQTWSGQKDMIAVQVGYHGSTVGCVDVSSYKFDGKGGSGAPDHTQVVPIPDVYRGIYQEAATAGSLYAEHVQKAIDEVHRQGRDIAGFIGESILSCGGQVVLPQGYLKKVFEKVRQAGGLCIVDEVQVGFGRVGAHYWGFELQDIIPDIVTMGKPIGNGHPMGAVVTTPEIAAAFANGMEFFSTFGGNPVSSAIGRTVLQVVEEENLQQQALEVGNYLKKGLTELQKQFPIIGDVRGHGFFLGFELVKDPITKTPAADQASYLANRMRTRGILMNTDGPSYNVLKIKPPMVFDKKNADFFLDQLNVVFQEDFMKI